MPTVIPPPQVAMTAEQLAACAAALAASTSSMATADTVTLALHVRDRALLLLPNDDVVTNPAKCPRFTPAAWKKGAALPTPDEVVAGVRAYCATGSAFAFYAMQYNIFRLVFMWFLLWIMDAPGMLWASGGGGAYNVLWMRVKMTPVVAAALAAAHKPSDPEWAECDLSNDASAKAAVADAIRVTLETEGRGAPVGPTSVTVAAPAPAASATETVTEPVSATEPVTESATTVTDAPATTVTDAPATTEHEPTTAVTDAPATTEPVTEPVATVVTPPRALRARRGRKPNRT